MSPSPTRPRLLVVRNPLAGRARSAFATSAIEALARQADIVVRDTERRGDAEAIARAVAGFDRLIVAGGDGTIGEAIAGLLARVDPPPPLGVLPLGTANVLAAELDLPGDSDRLSAALAQGPIRNIHLGLANGRPFAAMAGVGLDAHVAAKVSLPLKRRIGKGAYVVETLRQIATFAFPRYEIVLDGQRYQAASAIIAKGHFYGGRFVVCPHADLAAPAFQVALFGRGGRLAALGYGAALALGVLPRFVTLLPARVVEIGAPSGDPVQGDGDVIATLPVRLEIAPRALAVVASGLGQGAAGPI